MPETSALRQTITDAVKSEESTRKKKSENRKKMKPGTTFTKRIEQGPNKGDLVTFKVAAGGKPFPTRVVQDVGKNSTLKNNSGVKFGKAKK